MKKLLILGSVFGVGIIGLQSCKKEVPNQSNSAVEKKEDVSIEKAGPFVLVRCDIGRAKYNCESGWGLCNCQFLPDAPWRTAINMTEITNNSMVLKSPTFINNGQNTLFVDNDVLLPKDFAVANNSTSIIILKGAYTKAADQSVTVSIRKI